MRIVVLIFAMSLGLVLAAGFAQAGGGDCNYGGHLKTTQGDAQAPSGKTQSASPVIPGGKTQG